MLSALFFNPNYSMVFAMRVKLKIAVLFKKINNNRDSGCACLMNDSFNPAPSAMKKYEFMPNFMSLWCDPFWDGKVVSFQKIQIPEELLNSECATEACSFFEVDHVFKMRGPSMLQLQMDPNYWKHAHADRALVCNSFKCHFFRVGDKNKEDTKRDFLYASSFPIMPTQELRECYCKDLADNTYMFGLFNYNSINEKCESLHDFRLFVQYVVVPQISPNVSLLCIRGPSIQVHEIITHIAMFMNGLLDIMCPQSKSNFKYCASYCRDFGNLSLSPSLQLLLDPLAGRKYTSKLPLEIIFYSMYNALLVNKISPEHFLETFSMQNMTSNIESMQNMTSNIESMQNMTSNIESMQNMTSNIENMALGVPILCRILRDALAPWTFCSVEGKYWSDTSLNQSVEDQPFPFSFLPGTRVFQRDDCEGRVTQLIQMVKLLKCLFWTAKIHRNTEEIAAHYAKKGKNTTRLEISSQKWLSLLRVCLVYGKLFEEGIIRVHTTVGDVNFKSFDGHKQAMAAHDKSVAQEEPMSGHSFAILMYNDGTIQDFSILEATGWERRILQTDVPVNTIEISIMKKLSEKIKSAGQLHISGCLPEGCENKTYQNICFGDNTIFFKTICKDSEEGDVELDFGAGIGDMREGFQDYDCCGMQAEEKPMSKSIAMSMDTFLNVLCQLSASKNKNVKPMNLNQQNFWNKVVSVKGSKFQRHIQNAPKVKEMHQMYRNELIPMIKRCVCTPQKDENEILELMKSWAIVGERYEANMVKLLNRECLQEGTCSGILFSIPIKKINTDPLLISRGTENEEDVGISEVTYNVKSVLDKIVPYAREKVLYHPFMHSVIYNLKCTMAIPAAPVFATRDN